MRKYSYFTVVKFSNNDITVMIGKAEVRDEIDGKKVDDIIYVKAVTPYEGHEAYRVWLETLRRHGIHSTHLDKIYEKLKEKATIDHEEKIVSHNWW